jgi:hypothetical protein
MFLGSVRKLRNIRWVFMFLGPAEEHKRPICESRSFFCSSPLPRSSAPRCLLPTHRHPGSLLPMHRPPPAPRSPRAGHPPCLDQVPAARPRSVACTGPVSPRLPSPMPSRPSPSATSCLPRPSLALQRAPVVGPASPSSACRPPGPALPGCALPDSVRRPPGLAPPGRTPPHPTLPDPSRRWPVPSSVCSSSENRAPLCINFFS